MRVALYARVSTGDQTVDPQLDALCSYAAARGLEVVEAYVDQGFSGSKDRRPALDEMLAKAKRRSFDAIAVVKLDRLARSTRRQNPRKPYGKPALVSSLSRSARLLGGGGSPERTGLTRMLRNISRKVRRNICALEKRGSESQHRVDCVNIGITGLSRTWPDLGGG